MTPKWRRNPPLQSSQGGVHAVFVPLPFQIPTKSSRVLVAGKSFEPFHRHLLVLGRGFGIVRLQKFFPAAWPTDILGAAVALAVEADEVRRGGRPPDAGDDVFPAITKVVVVVDRIALRFGVIENFEQPDLGAVSVRGRRDPNIEIVLDGV